MCLPALQNSQLVAFPGLANGEIHLSSSSSRLQGQISTCFASPLYPCCSPALTNAPPRMPHRCNTRRGCSYRVSLLAGFRYLQLDEDLNITEITRVNPARGRGPGPVREQPALRWKHHHHLRPDRHAQLLLRRPGWCPGGGLLGGGRLSMSRARLPWAGRIRLLKFMGATTITSPPGQR